MTSDEIAALFDAKRVGSGKWRARCPVHKSRGLTLAITEASDRTLIHCHAGCAPKDVLASVGAKLRDLLFAIPTPAEAYAARLRRAEEVRQRARRAKLIRQVVNLASIFYATADALGEATSASPDRDELPKLWHAALASARRLEAIADELDGLVGYGVPRWKKPIPAWLVGEEMAAACNGFGTFL